MNKHTCIVYPSAENPTIIALYKNQVLQALIGSKWRKKCQQFVRTHHSKFEVELYIWSCTLPLLQALQLPRGCCSILNML